LKNKGKGETRRGGGFQKVVGLAVLTSNLFWLDFRALSASIG
jgi:hypothetical protein